MLPGRKPLAFCAWLFDCLGMQPGDELVDLFPGTAIVSRAWTELSPGAAAMSDMSSEVSDDVSFVAPGSRRRIVQVLGAPAGARHAGGGRGRYEP